MTDIEKVDGKTLFELKGLLVETRDAQIKNQNLSLGFILGFITGVILAFFI